MNIVPTDQPSIYDALNTLVYNRAQIAIVRPDNPPPGIAGFLLSVVDDDRVELQSDITNHYTEENSPVQDHIALQPEQVTTTGAVAELVLANPVAKRITEAPNPLPIIPNFTPPLAPAAEAQQAALVEAAESDLNAVTNTQSLYGYYQARLPQQPNQTKQQVAFGYLYQLWKGRQTFSIETPWGFFTNMAILSISANQGGVTRMVSDFTVTFQKIRTVRAIDVVPGLLAGRAVFQQAPTNQNGVIGQVTPTTAQESQFLRNITPFAAP